jgi:hypothetical protein
MAKHNCRAGVEAVAKYASQDLAHNQYLVLREYALYVNEEGIAWPGDDTVARNLRLGKNTVWRAKKALEAAGELEVVRRKGRNGPKLYRVAAVARGLPNIGGEPMGSPQEAMGSPHSAVGSPPMVGSEVVQLPEGKKQEGETASPNGNSTGALLSLQEYLRGKGIGPDGKIQGTGLYLREILELEKREKEARKREEGERAIETMNRVMAEWQQEAA